MNRKNKLSVWVILALLTGCSSTGKVLNDKQIAAINTHQTVLESLPEAKQETLMVYTGKQTIGVNVAANVALGLLTGSMGFRSGGNTPRTRFPDKGVSDLIKNTIRKRNAKKVKTVVPSQLIEQYFAERFARADAGQAKQPNQLTIKVKPVAWHLFYEALLQNQPTYLLEYASDIDLSLPAEHIHRIITCDKQSEQALPEQDWLANDALRVRQFANQLAITCVNKVFTELQKPPIDPVKASFEEPVPEDEATQ